jgi:hypothetical protein
MAGTYYKYEDQQVEKQIDWSVVGKGISDMLIDANKVREEKKAQIDKDTRDFMKYTQESPQGQFEDGNIFTNTFAHDMMQQQQIDSKLLKSGQMKLQDYTLRRQNYKDGTETLFNLQKAYQEVYKKRMEGLMPGGNLQALTGANMALVEGFADFKNSKAYINPATGVVNIGMMKMNEKTGQLELDKNSLVPVNVLMGKIKTEIPKFDVDGAMDKTAKGLSDVVRTIYSKASKTTYGTIEKLTGVLSMDAAKNPEFKKEIDEFNKAIDQQVNSYFANPYNLSSVITENLGKYGQESYTFNKDEADKDPNKILLKINSSTGLSTLDESGKNFKAQEAEARDWVKTQLKSRLSNERVIATTATTPYGPQPTQASIEAGEQGRRLVNAAQSIGALWGGNDQQITAAVESLANMNPRIKGFTRTGGGINVTFQNDDGTTEIRPLNFFAPNTKTPLTQEQFIKGASSLLLGNVDINKALSSGGYIKGAKFNPYTEKDYQVSVPQAAPEAKPINIIIPKTLFTMRSQNATPSLQKLLPAGFTVVDAGRTFGNTVQVYAPGQSAENNDIPFEFSANSNASEIEQSKADLEEFIKVNSNAATTPAAPGGTPVKVDYKKK